MNNRVKFVINKYNMQKNADDASIVTTTGDAVKGATMLVLGACAAAGALSGAVAEKITEPVGTDYDNARKSYIVGALEADVLSAMNKLTAERISATNKKQKSLRIVG